MLGTQGLRLGTDLALENLLSFAEFFLAARFAVAYPVAPILYPVKAGARLAVDRAKASHVGNHPSMFAERNRSTQ
jgi:hypothetical protein